MGFYSLYKIVKDIFRTIFGNRSLKYIFIIFILFFIFLFFINKGVFAVDGGEPSQSIYNDFNTALTNMSTYFNVDFISDWSNWNYQFGAFNGGYSLCIYNNGWAYVSNDNGSYAWTGSRPYNIYLYQVDTDFNIVWSSKVENGSTARFGAQMNTLTYYYSNSTNSGVYNTRLFVPSSLAFDEPSFLTSESDISTWNFTNLEISGGDVPYYTAMPGGTLEDQTTYIELDVEYDYINYIIGNNNEGGLLNQFISIDEDTALWTMSIPNNYLTNYFNVQNGGNIKFTLFVEQQNPFEQYTIQTNDITFNLTAEQIAKINGDSDKQIQGTIINQQQQIVDGQQQLQNTINDTNVDFSSTDLPSDSTQDITADGVNGIFTSIYNAFCVGNAQDIVFPIPFTNKNITLSATYVSDSLTNANASFIITIIQAFWWYLISRFIIKDVMDKINKIKGGNIEDIETTNIRGDML